jgi:hypothetical protein
MHEMDDSNSLFEILLKRHESDTFDFKRELHDFSVAEGREAFIKDIVCLANTPRSESAYLVFGVDYTLENGVVPVGLVRQEDGAKIVDQLSDKYVQPRPRVRYSPVCRNGKLYGILEIPVQTDVARPFLPTREFAGMKRGELWLRRDSKNDKADYDDTVRVSKWFSGGAPNPAFATYTSGEWEQFLQVVYRFESGRYFLLIADRVEKASSASLAGLGLAPW